MLDSQTPDRFRRDYKRNRALYIKTPYPVAVRGLRRKRLIDIANRKPLCLRDLIGGVHTSHQPPPALVFNDIETRIFNARNRRWGRSESNHRPKIWVVSEKTSYPEPYPRRDSEDTHSAVYRSAERNRTIADKWAESSGAQGRNRTTDTVIFSHVLYQLSYLGAGRARGPRSEAPPYRD